MNDFLNRYATPLTLGLFVVSAVSGVALFFHVGQGLFHAMHEWLSLVLLLPFGLHVWRNWRPMVGYFRRRTLVMPVAACLAVAALFALPGAMGQGGRGAPPFRAALLLTEVPLASLAPILKTTPEALQATLKQRGYPAVSGETTLAAIAATAGMPEMRLLIEVLPAR